MFYYAMRCSGVSAIEAKTMFYAALQIWASLEISDQTREAGEV